MIPAQKGKGVRKELLRRMQTDWKITSSVPPAPAAVAGAIGTGAAGGLASDLATGGLSLGLGTLIGTVVGALGGAGLAVAYNHKKQIDGTVVTWSDEALKNFFVEASLLYLAVAHFGRGRGNWEEGEYPEYWRTNIEAILTDENIAASVVSKYFDPVIRRALSRFYPSANF